MDESPFEPAQPLFTPDEGERLEATRRRIRQLRARRAALAGTATLAVAAIAVAAALTGHGRGGDRIRVAVGSVTKTSSTALPVPRSTTTSSSSTTVVKPSTTTVPPSSTTVPPTTANTPATTIPPATMTTAPPRTITGQVVNASGQPVAGAYVESAEGTTAVTNDRGQYTLTCGGGSLIAATWTVPLTSFGNSTLDATVPGPGYIFSGGATSLDRATPVKCGSVANFRLPAGSGVTIHFTNPMPAGDAGPADNIYLPGLNDSGFFIDPPLNADNSQVVDQLGAGTLGIDGVSTNFDCSGPGVSGSGGIWSVSVAAGQSVTVDCSFVDVSS